MTEEQQLRWLHDFHRDYSEFRTVMDALHDETERRRYATVLTIAWMFEQAIPPKEAYIIFAKEVEFRHALDTLMKHLYNIRAFADHPPWSHDHYNEGFHNGVKAAYDGLAWLSQMPITPRQTVCVVELGSLMGHLDALLDETKAHEV